MKIFLLVNKIILIFFNFLSKKSCELSQDKRKIVTKKNVLNAKIKYYEVLFVTIILLKECTTMCLQKIQCSIVSKHAIFLIRFLCPIHTGFSPQKQKFVFISLNARKMLNKCVSIFGRSRVCSKSKLSGPPPPPPSMNAT